MKIRVSIIIPAFNVENYLKECVQSCLELSNALECELIIVDNNSTDQTMEVAQQLQQKHPQFIQVVRETKKGAGAARNASLRIARGEWIQFLDADDLVKPAKIAAQLALIDGCREKPSFVAGAYERLKINGKLIPKSIVARSPFMNLLWGYGACGITSSNLWNRDLLMLVGGFEESKSSSQEAWLMFDLLKLNDAVLWDTVPNTIVRERPDGGQISSGKQQELTHNFFELRKEMIVYLQKNKPEILQADGALNHSIYRSFSIWLLSETRTPFHTATLSFLIQNLYRPAYQWKFLSPDNQYRMEAGMRRLRNSRINHKFHFIK